MKGGSVSDLAIELSSARAEKESDKVNLTNTLTDLLREMRNLTEHQRAGAPKRQNLGAELEHPDKAIRGQKPEIGPMEEESTDSGKARVGIVSDAWNLGAARAGRGDKGIIAAEEPSAGIWGADILKIAIIFRGVAKSSYVTRNTGGMSYNYDQYYGYHSDCPPINRPPITP